mgnify:FL=1
MIKPPDLVMSLLMYLVLWWWENYDFVSVIVNIVWICFNLYLPQVLWQQSRWRNSNVGTVLSKLILVIIVSYYGIKRETRKNGYQPLMTFILASLSYFRWMICNLWHFKWHTLSSWSTELLSLLIFFERQSRKTFRWPLTNNWSALHCSNAHVSTHVFWEDIEL